MKCVIGIVMAVLGLAFSASEGLAKAKPALETFLINVSALPNACQLEKAPEDGFLCPFDQNPFYSEGKGFVACLQNRLGMKSMKPARAVLLQAFQDTQSQSKQEIGVFAFELQSASESKAALTLFAAHDKEPGLEVVAQGSFLFWIWNDVDKSSPCYQAIRQQLRQKGVLDTTHDHSRNQALPFKRWGGWTE